MPAPVVLTKIDAKAGLIRINRPKQRNALNGEVVHRLVEAAQKFDTDPNIGAVVITGNEHAFAAGADITEMVNSSTLDMYLSDRADLWGQLYNVKIPIIAAVSGWCLGGGCELAMACDMIVASESAQFGQPEINIGIMPGAGGTQRLTRAVGKAIAMEMVLNSRFLTANEAARLGLVNRVVPVDQYLQSALDLANQIADRASLAVRMAKEAIKNAFESHLADGVVDERRAFCLLFSSKDQKEGMAAFIEKRKPQWQGK